MSPQFRFEAEAHAKLDNNMVASLKGQLLNRWLGVRLDLSGISLVTAVCLASTLSAGSLDAGLVGLMLSYALTVTGYINFAARFFTDTETQLSSVERMDHYAKVAYTFMSLFVLCCHIHIACSSFQIF